MPASASLTVDQCGPVAVGVTVVDPKFFENVWNKRVIDNKPYRVDICGTVGVTVVDPNNRIIDNKPYKGPLQLAREPRPRELEPAASCCVTGGAFTAAAYVIIPGYSST